MANYRCTKCGRESMELVLRTATKSCFCGGVAERFEEPEELARQGKLRAPSPRPPQAAPPRASLPPQRKRIPEFRPLETPIVSAIEKALKFRRRDVYAWRNNTGMLPNAKGRKVRFGLEGSADILGVTRGGRFFALEVKRDELSKPTPKQLEFGMRVMELGGYYAVVRSVDEALVALDRALGKGATGR